jgi:hypothetical protein
MKKIISLFAVLAIMSSLFVVNVSAATISVNIPEVEELSATDLAEFNTYLEDDLGEDALSFDTDKYKAYKVTFNLSELPVYTSDNKNRIMSFQCGLSFDDGGYAETQAAAVMSDSVIKGAGQLTNDEVTGTPVYRATYVKSTYSEMYSVKNATMNNAMVMVVVAEPKTVATPYVNYIEWYNATKSEVPATVNITPKTITFGKAASAKPANGDVIGTTNGKKIYFANTVSDTFNKNTVFKVTYTGSDPAYTGKYEGNCKDIKATLGDLLGGEIGDGDVTGNLHFGIVLKDTTGEADAIPGFQVDATTTK